MTTSLTKPANLSIDFVILCHNEPEVFNLIKHLQQYKQQQDRILILLDKSTDDYYKKLKQSNVNKIVKHNLDHDYSTAITTTHRSAVVHSAPPPS